jgi:hypothetical protein
MSTDREIKLCAALMDAIQLTEQWIAIAAERLPDTGTLGSRISINQWKRLLSESIDDPTEVRAAIQRSNDVAFESAMRDVERLRRARADCSARDWTEFNAFRTLACTLSQSQRSDDDTV